MYCSVDCVDVRVCLPFFVLIRIYLLVLCVGACVCLCILCVDALMCLSVLSVGVSVSILCWCVCVGKCESNGVERPMEHLIFFIFVSVFKEVLGWMNIVLKFQIVRLKFRKNADVMNEMLVNIFGAENILFLSQFRKNISLMHDELVGFVFLAKPLLNRRLLLTSPCVICDKR